MHTNKTHFREGKKAVRAIPKKGEAMDICATFSRKYICCRTHVLKSVHNCPFECSYCFLQNYLTDGMIKAVDDIDALADEIKEKTSGQPGRLFRIGTWELGDSLALERKTGQAEKMVRVFAGLKNAVLELKTKSDNVDSLIGLEHNGRTVVSWSLNTDHVIRTEEQRTASLEERLHAVSRTSGAGYLIGLHFDPMILYEGWQDGYELLVKKTFDAVSPDRVAWISMGSLRFNPEMKKKIENNYPGSMLTCAEMVPGDDAKIRYVKPIRAGMYGFLYSILKKHIGKNNLVYLCMERWDVWDKVFGCHPDSAAHLDYLFAKSLYERYSLGNKRPDRKDYESET